MNHLRGFSDIHKEDAALAGGKGASLGEMTNAGIPVPPGFVILAQAFDAFLEETDIKADIEAILTKTHHDVMHEVENASEEIQDIILFQELPEALRDDILSSFKSLGVEFVAVRSSATAEDGAEHAWAGQLDTYLNTTEEKLLENVKKCWASLFTPRAIFYRFEKGLAATHISVAVVVQKMVASEYSGIAFSVHPVTEDRNQMIMEAGFGLGEAIVSGQVTPDSYVVTKSPREIIDVNVSEQPRALYRAASGGNEWKELGEKGGTQVLTQEQILELADIIMRIENHYGFPCDIEWAYEDGEFYITQSRPITTLSPQKVGEEKDYSYKPKDYVRMFSIPAFPYLFSDLFLKYYQRLNVLSVRGEDMWVSFLPKTVLEQTLKEGRALFSDKKKYQEYREAFEKYMEESESELVTLAGRSTLVGLDIEKLSKVVAGLFSFYSKTEFFYTDGISLEDLAVDEKEFETLKSKGRVFMNRMLWEEGGHLKTLLGKISTQVNVPVALLRSYAVEELFALVQEGAKIDPLVLKERELYVVSGEWSKLGLSSKEVSEFFLKEYRVQSGSLVGTGINKGRVEGRVRVIAAHYTNFEKLVQLVKNMEDGEIIVAETTSPEVLPACKKAAAIVTNQGGILSHAAIIARELNIPCIVGTNVATQVLRDGDFVEVDAESGVVRVIKRNQEIHIPCIKDYDLTFESQGTALLFEDIVDRFYNPYGSVSYFCDNIKRIFLSKERLHTMNEEGKALTSEKLLSVAHDLEKIMSKMSEETKLYAQKGDFNREDAEHMLSSMGTFGKNYFYFDMSLWDEVYILVKEDIASAEKVRIVQEYKNKFRDDADPIFFHPGGYFYTLLAQLEKYSGLSQEELKYYRHDEILGLFDGEKVSHKEIANRKVSYVYNKTPDSADYFYSGHEGLSFIRIFAGESQLDSKHVIHGCTAHSTKKIVTGKVRILTRDYGDIESFRHVMASMERGEILVSPTTDPHMMEAIRKAGAIITDVGGLLSHSAIVAREFNIPCIIETKNASKVLKDGDLVEVDADNGVVRILERAKKEEPKKKELDKNHLSLSEWFADAGVGDKDAFRSEDNDKRERLKILQDIIGIPFDKPTQFLASDIQDRTPAFMSFLEEHGDEPCALRLIPVVDGLPKLRMRGQTVREVTGKWFSEQHIDVEKYRADFMPHSHESLWSSIFVVNQYGIFGEMVHGGHDQLTSGHHEETALRYQFSFDFTTWSMEPKNDDALTHIQDVVAHVHVSDTEKRKQISEKLSGTFHHDYLEGYFESVLSKDFGMWFVDYNRILGSMYSSMTLPQYGEAESSSVKGTVVCGKGAVQGTVVLLDTDSEILPDISSISNPILVTSYTMPQHVPLMKQSVAIVTDEGGLLSHASIISRELKKVCIIGTKVATQVLKDEDLVEVDADNGVVRVLEKK